VPTFGLDTPVLMPTRTAYRGKRAWLLWPALQYRVVTPLVYQPAVNAFQRALLGLARSGQRDLANMAGLLGLDPEFAELVRDELRTVKYLDEFGAITAAGADALTDGFLDPRRVVVTHVYQDLLTGTLWPAAVPAPMLVTASWHDRSWAELDLGTAGEGEHVRALAIPADGAPPDAPSADDVVEAVSRGSQAAPGTGRGASTDENADAGVGAHADTGWRRRPPERVVARVSMIASGQPVYLPAAIVVTGRDRTDTGESPTWLAFGPFGTRASQLLRRLIAIQCVHHPPLRRRIEDLTGQPAAALLAAYDKLEARLREFYGQRLSQRFGPSLREHHELIELLTLLERNMELARKREAGDRDSALNTAANVGWRIQEIVLREIARRRPPEPDPVLDRGTSRPPLWRQLMIACEEIGLRSTEYTAMSVLTDLGRIFRLPASPKVPELLAAAVLSAQRSDADHPVRRLASQRDTLLTDLTRAAAARNDSSHAELAHIDIDTVELSRRLAHETVAAFLGVPVPDDS
jgi:hypothetical protein